MKVNIQAKSSSLPAVQHTKTLVPYTEPLPEPYVKETASVRTNKRRFAIAPSETATFHVKPVPSTKNDKVPVFIDSFSKQYRELIGMFKQFRWDEKGVHLPEQDKLFFETVITNKHLDQYVTTNSRIKDCVKQQVEFTWFKSPVSERGRDPFELAGHTQGYEYKLEKPSGMSISANGRGYVEKPLREYLELSRTLAEGEKVIVQFGFKPADPEWYKDAERAEDAAKRKPTIKRDATRLKTGYAGFECCLRLIVCSPDERRLETLGRSYNLALQQLNGDNRLKVKRIQTKKFSAWYDRVLQRRFKPVLRFKNRMILTQREIENFIKLPQRTLQKDFEIKVNERDELSVHKNLRAPNGLHIGHSEYKGRKVDVRLPFNVNSQASLDDIMKTYIMQGGPRTGKDTSQINFIVEAAKLGCGAIVPDTICEPGDDRGMADSLRNALPKDRIIDVDLADSEYPIYFGFDDLIEMSGNTDLAVSTFSDDLTAILGFDKEYASKELTRLVARACRCNLYDMFCFLRSRTFAEGVYEELRETNELLALQVKHEYLDRKVSTNVVSAVKSRIDEVIGSGVLKNMFAQEPSKRFNLRKFIEEKKVVIIRMNSDELGEEGVKMIMSLLTLKVFLLKKRLAHQIPTFMTFNEPFQYMSDKLSNTISRMVVECPKFRLGLIFAFHNPHQVRSIWDIMQSASVNYFIFKNTNYMIYRDLQEQLKPIDLDTAVKTEAHESIFIPYIEGKQLDPIFVKMLPPAKQRLTEWYDNTDLTKQHNIKYGTHIDHVYKRIREREISLYKSEEIEKAAL